MTFDERPVVHRVGTWAHQQLDHAATTLFRQKSTFVDPTCAAEAPNVAQLTLAGGGGPKVDDGHPAVLGGDTDGSPPKRGGATLDAAAYALSA